MSTTPRILDREGNEIRVGESWVTPNGASVPHAVVKFLKPRYGYPAEVGLYGGPHADYQPGLCIPWLRAVHGGAPNTYRCPDLLLTQPASTDQQPQEAAPRRPERSER